MPPLQGSSGHCHSLQPFRPGFAVGRDPGRCPGLLCRAPLVLGDRIFSSWSKPTGGAAWHDYPRPSVSMPNMGFCGGPSGLGLWWIGTQGGALGYFVAHRWCWGGVYVLALVAFWPGARTDFAGAKTVPTGFVSGFPWAVPHSCPSPSRFRFAASRRGGVLRRRGAHGFLGKLGIGSSPTGTVGDTGDRDGPTTAFPTTGREPVTMATEA